MAGSSITINAGRKPRPGQVVGEGAQQRFQRRPLAPQLLMAVGTVAAGVDVVLHLRWVGAVHEVVPPVGKVLYGDFAVTHRKTRPSDPDRNLRIVVLHPAPALLQKPLKDLQGFLPAFMVIELPAIVELMPGLQRFPQEKFRVLKEGLDPGVSVVMAPYHTGFDESGRVTFSYYRERLIKNRAGMRWVGPPAPPRCPDSAPAHPPRFLQSCTG